MKKWLVLGFCMTCLANGFSHETNLSNRHYLDPQDVHIDHHGIYLNLGGTVQQVTRISADEFGPYIEIDDLIQTDAWRCPRGHANPPWAEKCQTCRWPD